jgi:Fur family peroxide stress response transcriptional regulator
MAILRVLEGNRRHPSVEEVHREVRKDFPTMSLATVYNTLEMLRKQGEVRRLSIDPARRRYDPETSAHHHLLCTECGRIVDIHRTFDLDLGDGEGEGFEIMGNHVEFTGRCPECQREEVVTLAEFKCEACGATKEGRCKPKKCPACGASGTMAKQV